MKILFAALKYDYGIPDRGFSFEYYNFYDTLVNMGHEVEYFDFYTLHKLHGKEKMTKLLREKVDELQPELLFSFLYTDEFDMVQLKKITTETKTVTFNWFADDHWRFDNYSKHWAPCFTFVSTTDAKATDKYSKSGYQNVLLTQWGANPRLYRKNEIAQLYDVTFVGQAYGERPSIIRALSQNGIHVGTWGAYWNLRKWHNYARKLRLISAKKFQQISDGTRVDQEMMIKIFQTSKINLNLSSSSTSAENQIKGRNFEIPACGGFQLSGYAERIEDYFVPNKEIVCYRNLEELVEKIRFYLEHNDERSEIAKAGYQRVIRDHTYEQRFNQLFHKMHLQ